MTKPRLISISGSVHSGKTTISRMIAVTMPNAFYLDGDLISAVVSENYSNDKLLDDILPEIHDRIIKFIGAGLRDGHDVIVDYPFTDETRQRITEALTSVQFEAKWFLLKPNIQKVLQGSVTRPELNKWEIERIQYHYSGSLMKTDLAEIIDSTDQIPEETFKTINEKL